MNVSEQYTRGGYEALQKGQSFESVQNYFNLMNRRRGGIFVPNRLTRTAWLGIAANDLSGVIREGRGSDEDIVEILTARLFPRIFSVAESVCGVSVAEALSKKFAREVCPYCGHLPCACKEIGRSEPELSRVVRTGQADWSICDWQTHFANLYGEANQQLGFMNAMARLQEEITEINQADLTIQSLPLAEAEKKLQGELADVAAWSLGVANLLGVDTEKALVRHFGQGCRVCKSFECQCGAPSYQQIRPENYQALLEGEIE